MTGDVVNYTNDTKTLYSLIDVNMSMASLKDIWRLSPNCGVSANARLKSPSISRNQNQAQ